MILPGNSSRLPLHGRILAWNNLSHFPSIIIDRWPVQEGVDGKGLLLEPSGIPLARIVALPEADWSPEMLVGLAPDVPSEAQFARRLAEHGCLVLIPALIDRACTCGRARRRICELALILNRSS